MKKQLLIYAYVVIFIFISSPVIQAAEETSINLRSSYAEVSVSQVQQLPHKSMRKVKKWGFYGHSTISHIYEKKSINGDKVVVDNSTGLTWHQSGSKKRMGLKKVKIWLKNMNKKGYAGSSDWRLPTVEEALSLLESTKNNDGLYINSVFDKKQDWIWAGDSFKPGDEWLIGFRSGIWAVEFSKGSVRWINPFLESFFVRPLRSGVTQIHEEDKVSSAILQKEKSEHVTENIEEPPPVVIHKQQEKKVKFERVTEKPPPVAIHKQQKKEVKFERVTEEPPPVAIDKVFINRDSNVFHKPNCSKLYTRSRAVGYANAQEAAKAGCLPCNYCKP